LVLDAVHENGHWTEGNTRAIPCLIIKVVCEV
jgi:hypothetical protein